MAPDNQGWQPIETCPKDGTRVLLGKIVGHPDHPTALWWATMGHWSSKWNNWNDGIEPSGLADPTHWMPMDARGAHPVWFSMESAPKDTRILGYLPEYGVGSMLWQQVREMVNPDDGGGFVDRYGWRIHGMLIEEQEGNQPTHWQPLPAPPVSEGG